jgi:hypothetical protein
MEVADNSSSDAPMLPNLLSLIPVEEQIASVRGDGVYDRKGCHEAIALRHTEAIIPTRKNANPWKMNPSSAEAFNQILRAMRRLGRPL